MSLHDCSFLMSFLTFLLPLQFLLKESVFNLHLSLLYILLTSVCRAEILSWGIRSDRDVDRSLPDSLGIANFLSLPNLFILWNWWWGTYVCMYPRIDMFCSIRDFLMSRILLSHPINRSFLSLTCFFLVMLCLSLTAFRFFNWYQNHVSR